MSAKTRFTMLSMFIERQLFSVRLTGDKSFAVFLPPALWSMPDGKPRVFKETHISAHVGRTFENGFGFKIKRSGVTQENEHFDSSLIVRDDRHTGFLYPIYSSLNGVHSSPIYKGRRGDRKIELIGVTGVEESICYTIFASSPHIEPPVVQGFSKYTEIFGKSRFTLYVTFFHLDNDKANISGSETPPFSRLNGSPWAVVGHNENPRHFAASMPIQDVERYLQSNHFRLASDYKLLRRGSDKDERRLSRTPGTFHRWPSVEDVFHSQWGIMSRMKNSVYAAPRTVDGFPKTPQQMRSLDVIGTIQNPTALLDELPPEVKANISPETFAAVNALKTGALK